MLDFPGRLFIATLATICVTVWPQARSGAMNYQYDGSLIGSLGKYQVAAGESLIEVARKFDLGFIAIADANPGVDPWIPPAGTLVAIPTAWILPDLTSRTGIVINIPEFRLYFFTKKPGSVVTFPLGIGDQGRDTPVGHYTVVEKIIGPAWHVPDSIRSELPFLPKVVPAGPNNPLGSHALRLSRQDLLIHGTNRPWGIGRRSSHGCLRLYPEDIVKLYKLVPKGTRVTVINQPIKACALGNRVFLEAHRPGTGANSVGQALHLLADKKLLIRTDFVKLIQAVQELKGIPVDISLTTFR
jgi:L,D-transpeptidase ErfK/SrfK